MISQHQYRPGALYAASTGGETLTQKRLLTLQRLSFIERGEWQSSIIGRAYDGVKKPWDGNIPKLIHQTDRSIHEITTLRSIASFRLQNPGYTYLFWTDEDIDRFIQVFFPDYFESFDRIPRIILKLDLFRYMLLYVFGGTYSDTDTYCLKPISTWARNQTTSTVMIVGIEADQPGDVNKGWARNFQLIQWTISMAPGFHVMHDVIKICQDKLKNHQGPVANDDVMELTGPGVFTDVLMQYVNGVGFTREEFRQLTTMKLVGNLLVLPVTGFQAVDQPQFGSKPEEHPDSFVRHGFRGSWC